MSLVNKPLKKKQCHRNINRNTCDQTCGQTCGQTCSKKQNQTQTNGQKQKQTKSKKITPQITRQFSLLDETPETLNRLSDVPDFNNSRICNLLKDTLNSTLNVVNLPSPNWTSPSTICWSPIITTALSLTNSVTPINTSVVGVSSIYDQGAIGSCTACVGCALFQYNSKTGAKQSNLTGGASRLWFYYLERMLMGTTYLRQDSGAYMSDAICVLLGKTITSANTVKAYGMLSETTYWPYPSSTDRRSTSTILTTPKSPYNLKATGTSSLFRIALNNGLNGVAETASIYAITPVTPTLNLNIIDTTLTSAHLPKLYTALINGPCMIGFSVYSSFYNITSANPVYTGTGRFLGGHAVLIVGYIASGQYNGNFIVQNSWGSSWGLRGFFLVPTAVLTNGAWSGCYTIAD